MKVVSLNITLRANSEKIKKTKSHPTYNTCILSPPSPFGFPVDLLKNLSPVLISFFQFSFSHSKKEGNIGNYVYSFKNL